MDRILFYRTGDPYGEFSNFAAFPIAVDGDVWPTSEHYFQAQKFARQEDQDEIRRQKSPMKAARMGRERNRPLRNDWEQIKDDVMLRALRAKFTQHATLRQRLIETGEAEIVEHTENDRYWADGGDGAGLNRLGKLLMQLREEFRRK